MSKKKYTDITAVNNLNKKSPYGDNPTDTEYLENEIPKFNIENNIWTIDNFGISYPCVTMEYLPYPEDLSI